MDPGNAILVFNNNEPGQPFNDDLVSPLCRIHNDNINKLYKLLGVWLDENLTYDDHVQKLCSKLTRALFFLR